MLKAAALLICQPVRRESRWSQEEFRALVLVHYCEGPH